MSKRHDAGIYGAIAANSSIMALLASQVASRVIHKNLAPSGTTMPYIVFGSQAGGRNNAFAGRHDDVVYYVKCVADADANGKDVAESVADLIETTFARPASGVTLGDSWVLRASTVVGEVSYSETAEKKTYIHAGRVVRLRGDK
jgi:hypothetical protein